MIHIAIDQIESGMLLAEDVIGPDGTVYLSAGTTLKARHKVLLENMGISTVAIKEVHSVDIRSALEPTETPVAPTSSTPPPVSPPVKSSAVGWRPDTAVVLKRNRMYKQTLESFKSIYKDVSFGKPVAFETVKAAITPLIDEITQGNDILSSLRMIQIADDYTYRHAIHVSLLSTMLGKWMGLDSVDLSDLAIAGLLHDLGKCKIPPLILNKPARLSGDEFEIMKSHVLLSYAILQESGQTNQAILRGVLEHHEKIDGTGYPNGLKAGEIHLFAKIIAVADVFDAMTSDRCYRASVSPFTVAEEMMRAASTHLDVEVVSIFLQNISRFFVGNDVELSNGAVGSVVMVNPYSVSRPLVKLQHDFVDLSKHYDLYITRVLK